jgi:tellurite resistance protein
MTIASSTARPPVPTPASSTASHPARTSASATMDSATAFAALALAAVSWDGTLTLAGSRALRHCLDYRAPYREYGDAAMVRLMDTLLAQLRSKGAQHLMVEAAEALTLQQRATAYAVAAEIMRSDGPLSADEQNILANLAATLELPAADITRVLAVMNLLHAELS